jgi:hypothetical protein
MRWIWTFVRVSQHVANQTAAYKDLYSLDPIWANSAEYEASFLAAASPDPLKVLPRIGAMHSSASTEDTLMTAQGLVHNNVITIADRDMRPYLLDAWTRCLSLVNPTFSEYLVPALHTQIIR